MRPEIAASVLERLERGFAQSIVLRLRGCRPSTRRSRAAIEGAIERDFLSVLQRNLSKRRPADLIAGLMNNISSEARDGFLGYLEAQEPELAQDVQRTMFTFEDIPARLNPRDMAGVLRDVPEETLLDALKLGEMQGSATVAFVLENVPRRLSERYVEDLAALAESARKEGEAAQIEITKAIQVLVREGQYPLRRKGPGADLSRPPPGAAPCPGRRPWRRYPLAKRAGTAAKHGRSGAAAGHRKLTRCNTGRSRTRPPCCS